MLLNTVVRTAHHYWCVERTLRNPFSEEKVAPPPRWRGLSSHRRDACATKDNEFLEAGARVEPFSLIALPVLPVQPLENLTNSRYH
jgi:hypothetical protein